MDLATVQTASLDEAVEASFEALGYALRSRETAIFAKDDRRGVRRCATGVGKHYWCRHLFRQHVYQSS